MVLNQWAASFRANRRVLAGCAAEQQDSTSAGAGQGLVKLMKNGKSVAVAVHLAARSAQSDGSVNSFSLQPPAPDAGHEAWDSYKVCCSPMCRPGHHVQCKHDFLAFFALHLSSLVSRFPFGTCACIALHPCRVRGRMSLRSYRALRSARA